MGTLGGPKGRPGRRRGNPPPVPDTSPPPGTPVITITTQPSATGQSGVNLAQAPVLQLKDSNGNNLAQSGVVIGVAVAPGAGTATFAPLPLTTNASGTATITSLSITGTVGTYSLFFSSAGYTGAQSNPITISAGTAAAATTTATVPAGNVGVLRTILIQARDSAGNACTTGGADVLVTITGANPDAIQATDNANGTYTSTDTPTASGTDTVAITLGGVAISGSPYTSVVTVSDPSYANKPADTVTFFESALSVMPPHNNAWSTTGMITGEVEVNASASQLTQQTDAGALKSPPAGWQVVFPVPPANGGSDGQNGFAQFGMWRAGRGGGGVGFAPTSKLYICFWLYIVTPDFQNQGTGTKIGYTSYGLTSRQNESFLMLRGDFASTASKPNGTIMTGMRLVWRISEGNTDGTFDASASERLPNAGTVAQSTLQCGVRNKIEQLCIKNTTATGAADGIGKVWLNGVLIHNWSNIVWTNPGAPLGFYEAHWDPVWGGDQGQVRSRVDSWIIDHFYGAGIP